jgi:hypothetical protein
MFPRRAPRYAEFGLSKSTRIVPTLVTPPATQLDLARRLAEPSPSVPARDYICPQPSAWQAVYEALLEDREGLDPTIAGPPTPLILGAWWHSDDRAKATRWDETVRWADEHGLSELIPALRDDEKYYGEPDPRA